MVRRKRVSVAYKEELPFETNRTARQSFSTTSRRGSGMAHVVRPSSSTATRLLGPDVLSVSMTRCSALRSAGDGGARA